MNYVIVLEIDNVLGVLDHSASIARHKALIQKDKAE